MTNELKSQKKNKPLDTKIRANDIYIRDGYYYNPYKRLKYRKSAQVFFSVGDRDTGKSSAWKKYVALKAVQSVDEQLRQTGEVNPETIYGFGWIRQTFDLAKKQANSWAKEMIPELISNHFGDKYVISSRTAGIFLQIKTLKKQGKKDMEDVYVYKDLVQIGFWLWITTPNNLRGPQYNAIKNVVYDEFQQEDRSRYITNEFENFLSVVKSVLRHRPDVLFIMVGNDVDDNSPYHQGWNITVDNLPPHGYSRIFQRQEKLYPDRPSIIFRIFVENNMASDYVMEKVSTTTSGAMLAGTNYGLVATGQKRINQSSVRVIKPTAHRTPRANFILNGRNLVLWNYAKYEWFLGEGFESEIRTEYSSQWDLDSKAGGFWNEPDWIANVARTKMANDSMWFGSRDIEEAFIEWLQHYKQ